MIRSPYTITWNPAGTPLVLCAAGQAIEAEPAWTAGQAVQESPRIRAATLTLIPRSNASATLAFTVYKDHASHAAARDYLGTFLAAVPWGTTATLRLAVTGGANLDLTAAVVISAEIRPVIGAIPRTAATWTFRAAPPTS